MAAAQALKRAAELSCDGDTAGAGGTSAAPAARNKQVGVSIIEAFSKKVEPKELEDTLRIEYRSKMLNPKVRTTGFAMLEPVLQCLLLMKIVTMTACEFE